MSYTHHCITSARRTSRRVKYFSSSKRIFTAESVQPQRGWGNSLGIKNKNIIDVGASIGDTALYFAAKGAKSIWGYEPDKKRQREAAINLRLNPKLSKRITYLNEGITPEKLNALIKKVGKCSIKIDCDNPEFPQLEAYFIAKLTNSNLKKVDAIVVETIMHSGPIKRKLVRQHFKVNVRENPHFEGSGIVYACKR
ncbi:MAG: hypothetical protein M1569_02295 [Candidatus Marsarchaeota archaeon]|nr:hypothetical protein [Candidatus Marsarchaeota archaeon]